MKKNKLTANSMRKTAPSLLSPGKACDLPVSTSTKANGAKNAAPAQVDHTDNASAEREAVIHLYVKLLRQKNPDVDSLRCLRDRLISAPENARILFMLVLEHNREIIIRQLYSKEATRTLASIELDVLKQEMGYESAPALERMHIDHVLTAWLRLRNAENRFTHCLSGESVDLASVHSWQGFLESAQSRFLRASESLERIRRLARSTPALQINIAQDGGKQLNIQREN